MHCHGYPCVRLVATVEAGYPCGQELVDEMENDRNKYICDQSVFCPPEHWHGHTLVICGAVAVSCSNCTEDTHGHLQRSGEQIIIRQNTSYMHAACWGYGYACGRRWGQSYSIYLPLHTNIKLLTTYLSLSLLVGLVTRLTFNLLQCSRTYFPSGLSDPQSSFPCQKYFVFRLSLANLLGRGPRMASIIARCSRLSWV